MHLFNIVVSFLGPAIFWITLPASYWNFFESHRTSICYVVVKALQVFIKYGLWNEIYNKVLYYGERKGSKLVVEKEYVRNSKIFLAIDALLEFMALFLICGLRYDIYKSETALLAEQEENQV